MKVFIKRMGIAALVFALMTGAASGEQSGDVAADCSNPENICITITGTDGESQSAAILKPSNTPLWQASCLPAPYDYEYQDTLRYITISRISENDMTYFVADVQIAGPQYFQTALSGGQPYGDLETVSAMAARSQSILAINSDDYGTQKYGTIIRNGELIRSNATTRNMLIVDRNGDMSVITDRKAESPKTLGARLLSENVWQTFEFGPELVKNGEPVTFSSSFDVISTSASRREPRTAIGQIGPLHYIVIVADGRQDGYSVGMTLPELQNLFVKYGAWTAMNLDGGGSAELWFQGQIVNRPAGGEERSVSDIIFF